MSLEVFHDPAETDFADAKLLRLWRYWRELCKPEALPSRDDVRPNDLTEVLPWTMLIDVRDRSMFRYRLVGTQIVRDVGYDLTGQLVSRAYGGPDWSEVRKDYDYVIEQRRPCLTINSVSLADGELPRTYQRLLCPLASDGATVDILLGGAVQKS